MELITDVNQLNGKTIKYTKFVEFDQSMALTFTDNTYTIARAQQCFDRTEIELDKHPEDYVLLQAEILTKDEYEKIKNKLQSEYKKQQTKKELRQLQELKKKYESLQI